MTEEEVIIKVRQRLGLPASQGPRILTHIPAGLSKLARHVANDVTKRDLLMTDKTVVQAVVTNTNFDYYADLSTIISTYGVMLDYLEYGTVYYAPYSGAFTANAATDVANKSNNGFWTGLKVQVSNSGGALPAGLVASTDYFVVPLTVSKFQFVTTRAEAHLASPTVVDIVDAGSGTNTVTPWEQETVQFTTKEFGDMAQALPVNYIFCWLVGTKLFTNVISGTFYFTVPFVPTLSTLPVKLESDLVDTLVDLYKLQSEIGNDSK